MPSDIGNRVVNGENNDIRIWSVLDKMDKRLHGIETTLMNLVRLDERVNNHDKLIDRLSKLIEDHDSRLRNSELDFNGIGNREMINANAVCSRRVKCVNRDYASHFC